MPSLHLHRERHAIQHIGWLRAAVLGANDGLLSTASLIVGVASAGGGRAATLTAGIAGLAAGAFSMAAGEFVSVSSQSDLETADLQREERELKANWNAEERELAAIYVDRGVSEATAKAVAQELMRHDALEAHARDELGLAEVTTARPAQAATASAVSFAVGGFAPLLAALVSPSDFLKVAVIGASLVLLALLGSLGAATGGAPIGKATVRVTLLGAAAMLATVGIGRLFGTVV